MHLSLWYDAFNSQMLRRGIGGSNGISMLSFLRNLADLHSGYTKFTLQPMQDSFSPRFHWHFLIDFFWFCFLIFDGFWGFFVLYLIDLLMMAILSGVRWNPGVVLIFIFEWPVMLSNFSCIYLLFVLLHLRRVCSFQMPIFRLGLWIGGVLIGVLYILY